MSIEEEFQARRLTSRKRIALGLLRGTKVTEIRTEDDIKKLRKKVLSWKPRNGKK